MFVRCGASIVHRFKFPQLLKKPDLFGDSGASKLLSKRTLETRLYFALKPDNLVRVGLRYHHRPRSCRIPCKRNRMKPALLVMFCYDLPKVSCRKTFNLSGERARQRRDGVSGSVAASHDEELVLGKFIAKLPKWHVLGVSPGWELASVRRKVGGVTGRDKRSL